MNDTTNTPDALDGLAAEAHLLQSDPGQPGQEGAIPPAPEPPRLSNEQIIGGALSMVRDVFCSFTQLKSPQRVVTPEAVGMLAGAWATVCNERGINLQDYMGHYGTVFTAIGVTAMVGVQLNKAVREEIAERDIAARNQAAVDATATPVA